MLIRPRETVIMAADFDAMVAWYRDVLGLTVENLFQEDYHYANLESPSGVRIGIASAEEMGVKPGDRSTNTVLLQFETEDVKILFEHLAKAGGKITFGPSHDEKGDFWYGGFNDLEGNPIWVVDKDCP